MNILRASRLLPLAVFAGCTAAPPPVAVDRVAEQAVISDLETQWSDMYRSKNLDGITALLAQDSVLIMPGAEPIVGAENVREATRTLLESDDDVTWRSDFAYVSESGDMAYDYGTATTRRPDGTVIEGNYLVVWIKEDGEWKVAADMFN